MELDFGLEGIAEFSILTAELWSGLPQTGGAMSWLRLKNNPGREHPLQKHHRKLYSGLGPTRPEKRQKKSVGLSDPSKPDFHKVGDRGSDFRLLTTG